MKSRFWIVMWIVAEIIAVRDPYWQDDYVLPALFLIFFSIDYFGEHKDLIQFARAHKGKSLADAWIIYRLSHGFQKCSKCGVLYKTKYKGRTPKCWKCRNLK